MYRLTNIFSIVLLLLTLSFGTALAQSTGPKIRGNVYGGGENAKVLGQKLDGEGNWGDDNDDDARSTKITLNSGEVYGNIYGGGALADVYGNTSVNIADVKEDGNIIKSGKFAGEVFGGGEGKVEGPVVQYANVSGNTYVHVSGGEIIWNRDLNDDATHNIYAGGNMACIVGTWSDENTCDANTGTTNLTMTRGLLGGDLLSSDYWMQAYSDHENPQFYAFGGGYGIYTKAHKSDVQIMLPLYQQEGISGGDEQLAPPRKAEVAGEENLPIVTDQYGVAWTTVLGILGGGYNGHVEETNVLVGDATYAHRVYGGGLGSYEGWEQSSTIAKAQSTTPNTDVAGYVGTTGKLPLTTAPASDLQTTHVVIAGGHIHGDVFGGGAGVAPGNPVEKDGKWSIDRTGPNTGFTDFTEIARVKGNTLVETCSYRAYKNILFYDSLAVYPNLDPAVQTDWADNRMKHPDTYLSQSDKVQRASIFGNVYGGGDVANVTGNTSVLYRGGQVFGQTFGAGLGRLASQAYDYTTIGKVTGNSSVEMTDTIFISQFTLTNLPVRLQDTETTNAFNNRDVHGKQFFEVQNNTFIGINFKPHAWDDVYGGGRNGVTLGSASVDINGGLVGNNVFGGGLGDVRTINSAESITSADVRGNTTVTVRGGKYLWRQIADVNGNIKNFVDEGLQDRNIIDNKAMHQALFEPVKDFFNYRTASYTRDHSIYGGGNIACKVGTYANDAILDGEGNIIAPTSGGLSTVDMQYGLFEDQDIMWTDDETWNLATFCRYLACENASNYQFGVFGGGYGPNTKVGSTEVILRMGELELQKEAANPGYPSVWNQYMSSIMAWIGTLSDEERNTLYGGNGDANGNNRALVSRMAHSINVPSHTVLTTAGGGLAGYVAGNTSVHQYQRSGALRVYGGGIGLHPSADDLAKLTQSAADAMTYGQVGGSTSVNVEYGVVVKDVFGGGAGVESKQAGNDGHYVDFPNMALVKGKTEVHVGVLPSLATPPSTYAYSPVSTLVYGSVYGGGDVANVGDKDIVTGEASGLALDEVIPRTQVIIDGGCVFKDVFAGGSGRLKEQCSENDGYKNLGAVYGNAQIKINQPEATATINDTPTPVAASDNATWLWKNVYGGGQNGTVYGNTDVIVLGGNLGYNIFGGGLGNISTPATGEGENIITSANVTQNSNVRISGGQWCLSQSWNESNRSWNPVRKDKEDTYSPQYEPLHKKFNIDHNVYGGGNVACVVGTYDDGIKTSGGQAYVAVTKGLLTDDTRLGRNYTGSFFEQPEWENVYTKHASPHFSVFGGGYGFNTKVEDTYVNVNMGTEGTEPSDDEIASKPSSQIFVSHQTLMDVIGGGYEGTVNNTCHVDIDGYTFMRNAFGGAYYASVGSTEVNVTRVNMDNVYGGGMMGDVKNDVNVKIGTAVSPVSEDDARSWNTNLIINQDVYGANDVAGYVGAKSNQYGDVAITEDSEGVKIKLNGGHIHGNVYGGGNGNYLYKIDEEVAQVSVLEDADLGNGVAVTLYRVPLRISDFPSLSAMSDQQKMVNVISYRPATMKTDIDFKGNSTTDRLLVDGNIFGGGNSATISDYNGAETGEDAHVKINVGSHIRVGGVYLGSDGEALFASQHGYMTYFPQVNNLQLYDHIDWTTPENQNIPIKFLPTPVEERPNIYKNNLDLYFMPVEMSIMPEVTWGANRLNNSVWIARGTDDNGTAYAYNAAVETEAEFTDAEIGTFCCGGNRGNMDTETLFHIHFPEGLTITENIIGGCNNANYTYNIPGQYDGEGNQLTLDHTGGFLLGTHGVGGDHEPQINLTLRNKFRIELGADGMYPEKCNVFGGCYRGGTVRGDIRLEVLSNMLMSATGGAGLDSVAVRRSTDASPSRSVCGIYGGGYGSNTWVYGDTDVRLGNAAIACSSTYNGSGQYNTTGVSCYHIFGGGREGSVVGNTAVRVLNGRVGSSVVGASYSGYLYGNAQVIVGYRGDYYVCQQSGKYQLNRVDDDPQHAYYVDANGKPVIKKEIWLTKGDLVSKASYEELALDDAEKEEMFTPSTYITYPTTEWDNINIQVDKAIYGGGYALAGGGSVGAGSYTVRKYTSKYNLNEYAQSVYELPDGVTLDDDNGSEEGGSPYGGNTFVMIGDRNIVDTRDHITISSSQLRPITPTAGDNLFGKYYEVKHGTDTPDDKSDDYITIEYIRVDRIYDPVLMAEERFYEYTGEGGIYGDGHLSLAEGFRLSDMLAYGYNGTAPINAKLMNCIHRFDIVRLADCCFSLLGDRDYASTAGLAVDATPFSLANVGELKMISSLSKDGVYMDPLQNKRSRNYMGLSNRVTNVGAVYSDVSFEEDKFHHGNEGKYNDRVEEYGVGSLTGLTYKAFKQKMIETYYDCTAGKLKDNVEKAAINFQLRNDGTAKNLIGIGSGYALVVDYEFDRQKTQDILTAQSQPTIPDNQGIDGTYYGPVKGVFEVNLISVRDGEAGGYVYAQNIHDTETHDGHATHFLEASGNFVFPVTSQRKVIDDCYPVKYNGEHKHSAADGHYWYVTGLKYFYNATITGFTFDNKEMTFDMANSNLITLAGAKAGQEVWLEDFHIVNRHTVDNYECDFERDVNKDTHPYDLINQTDATDANKAGKYMFSISTSKLNTYAESYEEDDETVNVPYLQTMHLNPLNAKQNTKLSDNTLDVNDAPISIRITDNVKNNGMVSETESYYKAHLSDPCQAVILLTVPAKDDNGFVVYNNDLFDQLDETGTTAPVKGKQYYILNFDGTYLGVNEDDLSSYNTQEKRKLLYVLKDYRPLTADEKNATSPDPSVTYYISNDGGKTGVAVDKATLTDAYWEANKNSLYVVPTPVKYEYTIDLTIRYIKGPSHSGHINIKNCALPGEMIRLSHENVIIDSDENSLPHNGNFWIIGPGRKVADDGVNIANGWHWEFVDEYTGSLTRIGTDLIGNPNNTLHYNDPASRNLYYPYNPFIDDPQDRYRGKAYNSLMAEGLYHPNSAESKEYFLPAYYYMDGYVAQYCYTVQNINDVFRTDILPVDTLVVHNYHRMLNVNDMPGNTGEKNIPHDLFVPWAAAQTNHRPRVYIQDVEDLKAFKEYLARTEDTKMSLLTILQSGSDGITQDVTYSEVIKPASDAGAGTDFILMADITVPDNWEPIANFNGSLHGNGHVISGLGNKALFTSLGKNAHIYNLGLPTGRIATTKGNATYSCCYTFADNTVYRKNGDADTHYTENDWRYGRVAYDLNQYYLERRISNAILVTDEDEVLANKRMAETVTLPFNEYTYSDVYVEDIYRNGDYRYARYNLSPATSEYLRNDRTPLYAWGNDPVVTDLVDNDDDAHISKHDYEYDKENNVLSHSVDEARGLFNDDAVAAEYYADATEYNTAKGTELDDDAFAALSDAEKTKTPAKAATVNEYRPLFDEAHVADNGSTATVKRNDYIFFGQTLNLSSVTDDLGTVGSTLPTVISAGANVSTPGNAAGVTHAVENQTNRIWRAYGFYQSKADDAFHFNKAAWALHPELTAIDFTGAHDVSPNHEWAAGYAPAEATAATSRIFYPMVMDIPEGFITSFNVDSNKDAATYSNETSGHVTQNLLVYNNGEDVFVYNDVDESDESTVAYHNIKMSGSPATYSTEYFHLVDKQDFNAPIAFNVNTRAWYERLPQSYRNVASLGYDSGSAWEGIVLPFTATKVTAEKNGEISHFYGNDELHHEYWLRGFTAVNGDKATFARPAKDGSSNFVEKHQTAAKRDYTYPANTYFTSLFNYNSHNKTRDDDEGGADAIGTPNNEWYSLPHTFTNYVPLTAEVPYIVAFPGDDFYEFSMESFYHTDAYGKEEYKQKATFESGATTIKVSDDNAVTTSAGGYDHKGSYLHKDSERGINAEGSAFEAGEAILPFRTYMPSDPLSAARRIRIVGTSGLSQDNETIGDNGDDDDATEDVIGALTIWTEGMDICVESPVAMQLAVYNVQGMKIGVIDVQPGISSFTTTTPGVYVVARKKVLCTR